MHLAGKADGPNDPSERYLRRDPDSRPLVIVLEDEPTQRNLLAKVIEREGYDVLALGDGETGMRAIVEYSPQLILLDLNLPRIDGFEICRQLRADPLTATLPVIVI